MLFNTDIYLNKRLTKIYKCTTVQEFLRTSLNLSKKNSTRECSAAHNIAITQFKVLWSAYQAKLASQSVLDKSVGLSDVNKLLYEKYLDTELLLSAQDALDHFVRQYGGSSSSCISLKYSRQCRGALAGETDYTHYKEQ